MEADLTELELLKKQHEYYAIAHQVMTQRAQFYAEEFDSVKGTVDFLRQMAGELKAKIEALEKPVEGPQAAEVADGSPAQN